MATIAPSVACRAPVVSGTSESVVAPGPIFVHCWRMLCVISSSANVAMPGREAGQAHQWQARDEGEHPAERGREHE